MSDEELIKEFREYQVPPEISDLEPYLEIYRSKSQGRNFFRGFKSPNSDTKARVYRTVEKLSKYNFIVLNSKYGMVLKCETIDEQLESKFQELFDQGFIFVPPGYDKISSEVLAYNIRLLEAFIKDLFLNSEIIINRELEDYFVFLSFNDEKNIANHWKNYISGGLHLSFQVLPDELISIHKLFPIENHISWSEEEEDELYLTVSSPSLVDFYIRTHAIQKGSKLKRVVLDTTLKNNNSGIGVLKYISGPGVVIPIIGTPYIYVDNPDLTLKLPDISLPDENESFTLESFSEMDIYHKASLIKSPSGHWLSFLEAYKSNRIDPLSREPFSEELNSAIDQEFEKLSKGIGKFFLHNYNKKSNPPIIISTQGILYIYFDIVINNYQVTFWKIPYIDNSVQAMEVLLQKVSDNSIFSNKIFLTDPLLSLNPKALNLFLKSMNEPWPLDEDEQIERLNSEIFILLSLT